MLHFYANKLQGKWTACLTFAMLDNNKMLSSGVIRLDRLIMLRGKDKYNQKENSLEGDLVPVFELCCCGSGLGNAWCCVSHTCVHTPAHTHTQTHSQTCRHAWCARSFWEAGRGAFTSEPGSLLGEIWFVVGSCCVWTSSVHQDVILLPRGKKPSVVKCDKLVHSSRCACVCVCV